jgi:hypothetical protein
MRSTGGDRVNVFGIDQISGKIIDPDMIDVFDLQNGRYEVTLRMKQTGSFLLYVLINGVQIQLSPFILYVKPGDPDPRFSTVSFTPFTLLSETNPPEYKMCAGDTLFFKLNFKDISGANVDEKIENMNINRIMVKINGKEALPKQVCYDLILADFGDNSIKARFFQADTQRIEVYFDRVLLPFEIDPSVLVKLGHKIDTIHSKFLMLNITPGYAYSK